MQVPSGCRSLKVQAWGAGGGGGHFKGGQCGDGGGGAFAEALIYVTPEDELEVTTSCLSPMSDICRILFESTPTAVERFRLFLGCRCLMQAGKGYRRPRPMQPYARLLAHIPRYYYCA